MKFGFFDDRNREYVIQKPDTPLPWINYLGSDRYFGIISNTAGGYSFYQDARLRRITRYRYNNAPLDLGGRYLYIRDNQIRNDQEAPVYWSPTWQPVQRELDQYQCRVGLGYTKIKGIKDGIDCEGTYFIPPGKDFELWHFDVKNSRSAAADLSLFFAVEFCLWDAWDDQTNFQRNLSIGEVEVENGVIYHKTEYRERRDHYAYFACSEKTSGFETQREAFLGPYRGWDRPLGVERGSLTNSNAHGWQPVGVHQVEVSLKPGEERSVIVMLGYQENPKDQKFSDSAFQVVNKVKAQEKIEKYLNEDFAGSSLQEIKDSWQELLGVFQVKSPEPHLDRMVNIWNQYQVMATFNFSRSASYFESGIGRGMGFRDSNQDLLGFVHLIPEKARARILDLAATQKMDGSAYHQYQPLTRRGNDAVGSGFNDDPLWLVLAVAAYLKETADWEILGERIPYDNQSGTEAALYEHLERAVQFTLDRLGPQGLPLIGRADWNDCLNLNCYSEEPGQPFQTTTNREGNTAESIFIAGLFILACREMAAITDRYIDREASGKYLDAARKMERSVWESGWDGEWFKRAFDANGNPVGSKACDEGKIFVEPQGICVMAGLGVENGSARTALDSVEQYLASDHGIVLHQPAYTKYYLNLGEISSYPPGYKENAGIFCHTNPWIMIAEAMLGNSARALDYYLRINPSKREEISELHKCEPYVYAQMIAGKDAATHGEAKNSWLTGTAAWNFVAASQWILGIRPDYEGLIISPMIPEDWSGFRLTRKFRGVIYRIDAERQGLGNQIQLHVNGHPLNGILVKPLSDHKGEVEVKVLIGDRAD